MSTLWFDLEATLITSWDEPFIINAEKIFFFLKTIPHDDVGIFSFAIWDDKDRDAFNSRFKPMLEDAFGFKIVHVPTKQELFHDIKKASRRQFSWEDFFDFWRKDNAFSDWIRATKTGHHILIDDMVETCTMTFPKCSIQMIRI